MAKVTALRAFASFLLFFARISHGKGDYSVNGTVYYTDGKYHIEFGLLDKENGVAYGTYDDALNTTGWGELNIASGSTGSHSDQTIMFAAGYLEGALTAGRINENYENNYDIAFRGKPEQLVKKIGEWFDAQEEWMRNRIKSESENSSLWRQMGNIVSQYDGLIAGYTENPPRKKKNLGKFAFQLLNGIGDYITLSGVLSPDGPPDWSSMTEEQISVKLGRMGHCSALIKVLPGYEDIFAGHSSWFAYGATMRIYKHYFFNLKDPSTGAKRMSFSSYPGYLVSLDDLYIMDRETSYVPILYEARK